MAWERRPRPPHACRRPNVRKAQSRQVGDIWRCKRCGTRWELTYKGLPARNRTGPLHENTWRRRESEDYEAVFGVDDPPRQTGTGWLTTAPE